MTHLMNAAASTSISSTCRGFAGVAMAAHDRASRPHTRLCRRPAPSLCRREASRTSYRLSSAYSGPAALARRSWTEHCDEFANKPREISYPAELLPGHATSSPLSVTPECDHRLRTSFTVQSAVRGVVHQVAHEIQPFGHLLRMPIALAESACREAVAGVTSGVVESGVRIILVMLPRVAASAARDVAAGRLSRSIRRRVATPINRPD